MSPVQTEIDFYKDCDTLTWVVFDRLTRKKEWRRELFSKTLQQHQGAQRSTQSDWLPKRSTESRLHSGVQVRLPGAHRTATVVSTRHAFGYHSTRWATSYPIHTQRNRAWILDENDQLLRILMGALREQRGRLQTFCLSACPVGVKLYCPVSRNGGAN